MHGVSGHYSTTFKPAINNNQQSTTWPTLTRRTARVCLAEFAGATPAKTRGVVVAGTVAVAVAVVVAIEVAVAGEFVWVNSGYTGLVVSCIKNSIYSI
jgi:hypothetical protein